MAKIAFKPGNMIYPLPAVMVTCGANEDEHNIITIAWTGTICTNPPMCYISVRPNRHSYAIIEKNREFVINLTTHKMAKATDWCGIKSGAKVDKFQSMHLTKGRAQVVNVPTIEESPVNIECKVTEIIKLGTHDMFMAEVVNVMVDDTYLDATTNAFDLGQAGLLNYSHGHYYEQGSKIGKFGFSVQKKKKHIKPKTKKK